MDFEFTEDQTMLRDTVQRFVAREYSFEHRQKILATPFGFSPDIWRQFAEQGVLGTGLPEEHGGFGGPTEIMVVMEELGKGLVLEPFMSTVVIGGGLIRDRGTAEQQADLLPRIIAGECKMALAHHEPGARYVLNHVNTTVSRNGNGYLLSGSKTVVLDGAVADVLILSAREGSQGELSLFVVSSSAPELKWTRYRTQDGRSAADVSFARLPVQHGQRLGEPGAGLGAVEQAVDQGLAALCAEAVGAMEAVNEATLQYLRTRKQFGQPIGRFQVLQHRMADMFLMATQAKSMSYLATGRCRETSVAERRHALSAAKAFVGQAARFVGQQSVQLHGGMGMSAELSISHYFKRLTLINATFGDIDHHVGVLSDQLLAEAQ